MPKEKEICFIESINVEDELKQLENGFHLDVPLELSPIGQQYIKSKKRKAMNIKIEIIDFEEDRYCPVFNRIIDCEWCYEALLGICHLIRKEAVPELNEISSKDMKKAYELCLKCKYSELT